MLLVPRRRLRGAPTASLQAHSESALSPTSVHRLAKSTLSRTSVDRLHRLKSALYKPGDLYVSPYAAWYDAAAAYVRGEDSDDAPSQLRSAPRWQMSTAVRSELLRRSSERLRTLAGLAGPGCSSPSNETSRKKAASTSSESESEEDGRSSAESSANKGTARRPSLVTSTAASSSTSSSAPSESGNDEARLQDVYVGDARPRLAARRRTDRHEFAQRPSIKLNASRRRLSATEDAGLWIPPGVGDSSYHRVAQARATARPRRVR